MREDPRNFSYDAMRGSREVHVHWIFISHAQFLARVESLVGEAFPQTFAVLAVNLTADRLPRLHQRSGEVGRVYSVAGAI